ncbi:DUF3298 and DUF4163 domain-containing protein [Maribacter sp. ACAM166]|uniref:DUF3298 and DUF4163 domain-containing protein n=1 Tax=Maribacter sp. ACAM166 TaxID=2508996 RepID=UPI001484F269|nr:DUF3298 and DUF4163 domain-containing protein [Maribacter sp. ACAM166]
MKSKLIYLLICMLLFSCENENKLAFEPLTISNKVCENCSTVKIGVPKALNKTKLGETINIALKEEIIAWLNFDEESNAQSIEGAIESFIKDYEDLNAKFPEESMPWEATINGTITFENKDVLTIKLKSYLFTGGAHGYNTVRFLNFDKVNSTEMDYPELFKSKEDFITFTERIFRKQENIPAEAAINSTGFMFETENFYLPENIGYTNKGLLLFYEPYEIASYGDGPIILTIPFTEANVFLNLPIKP